VAGIQAAIKSETSDIGRTPKSDRSSIVSRRRCASSWRSSNAALWKKELMPEWQKNGIYVRECGKCRRNARRGRIVIFSRKFFRCVLPWQWIAQPSFSHILNEAKLLVRGKNYKRGGERCTPSCRYPRAVSRLIARRRGKGADEPWEYIFRSLIKRHIGEWFPGLIW